jgi:MFS family permease
MYFDSRTHRSKVVFNSWGAIQTFGAWQSYYTATLPESASTISWIGSLLLFLLFFLGPIAGRALDAGLYRYTFIAGVTLQVFGIMMTSLGTKYYQILLAQGICQGIGNGLQFAPSIALVSTYFSKHRAIALGIAASGSSTGGVVYPLIVRSLLPKIGFGWTMRVIGFITLFVGCIAGALLKTHIPPRKTGPLIELRAFKELPYLLFNLGMFFVFWGLFFPFYYIPSFARDISGSSASSSTIILLVANVSGIPSRYIMNSIADWRFGPLTLLLVSTSLTGVVDLAWMSLNHTHHPTASLWAFAVVYGFFASSVMGLFPAALSGLTTDLSKQGARMGMGFGVAGIAAMTGPVTGGALISRMNGGYQAAQIWAGCCLFLGCLILGTSRVLRAGWSFETKI